MTTTFTPSAFQSAIADFVQDPAAGNLCVEAVAGSGKTTTIVWLVNQLPQRKPGELLGQSIRFLAFNKDIAAELQRRCPSHVCCSTFHSLGLAALKTISPKLKVAGVFDYKTKKKIPPKVPTLVWSRTDRNDPDQQNIIRLVGLLKSRAPAEGVDWLGVAKDILLHHDLSFDDERKAITLAVDVFHKSNKDLDTVDFDDMLFLPILHNCSFEPQDWVFVDESQDLNEIQHEILWRLAKRRPIGKDQNGNELGDYAHPSPTRFVFVGDRYQAIYGFRGAAADSLDRLAKRFNCTHLPLSISYRCSKAVVKEAQSIFLDNKPYMA